MELEQLHEILDELLKTNSDLLACIEQSGADAPASTELAEKCASIRVKLGEKDEGDNSEVIRKPLTASGYKKYAKNAIYAFKKQMKKKNAAPAGQGKGPSGEQSKKKKAQKEERKRERREARTDYENTTKPGERKDVSGEMAQHYNPKATEAAWYDWWEKKGFFKGDALDRENPMGTYVMCIPPPNVTGQLHLGHALTNSVEDCLVRWNRMMGKNTLWVPGMDHAGIATQMVVEKKLAKQGIRPKVHIGRDDFVKEVWKWKEEYGGKITKQLRRLGSSLDWDREVFTMDDKMSKAVVEALVRFDEAGIVYRQHRLVNWDCTLQTAISDVEVEHIDLDGPTLLHVPGHGDEKFTFGVMHHFNYLVADEHGNLTGEKIEIATTRLETMLGDTAVAMHPNDKRYKDLRGTHVVHPFYEGRLLQIVPDPVLVDMEFGTGAVKVTPAHDPNDFECGKRHKLEFLNILEDDGTLNDKVPEEFRGLPRITARQKVLKALEAKSLMGKTEPHKMAIAISSRTKDIIEPVVKPQWWVDCKDMARRAIEVVDNARVKILPEHPHTDTWKRWLGEDNIRPWCISRQLWWGHRIPAWYVYPIDEEGSIPPMTKQGKPGTSNEDTAKWVIARDEGEALAKAKKKFGLEESQMKLERDDDVLDTWFSSGLFPFSCNGWPDTTTDEYKAFFPTSVLETGHDIIFFWVARMVMMSLQLTDQIPFEKVLLHAMVRDAHGRKMSKSLGNVINPLDVIEGVTLEELHKQLAVGNLDPREITRAQEGQKSDFPDGIAECGTDALRFTLCAYMSQGRDVNLDVNRIESYRRFCNKLWNILKFILFKLGPDFKPAAEIPTAESPIDKWIESRLYVAAREVHRGLDEFELGASTTAIHDFWQADVADTYLEAIKPVFFDHDATTSSITKEDHEHAQHITRNILHYIADMGLRLLHVFMPFLTEELWQRLPRRQGDAPSIMVARWPWNAQSSSLALAETVKEDAEIEAMIGSVKSIVHAVNQVRTDSNITNLKKLEVRVALNPNVSEPDADAQTLTAVLASCKGAPVFTDPPKGWATAIAEGVGTVYVNLAGAVDNTAEIKKLESRKKALNSKIAGLERFMSNDGYSKVPEDVKAKNDEKKVVLATELQALNDAIEKLSV